MKNTIHYTKQNYILIVTGLIIAVIGYFVMSGGNPEDPTDYSKDIFSERRITVAPIIILLGYGIVLIGIMKKVGNSSSKTEELAADPISTKQTKKKK